MRIRDYQLKNPFGEPPREQELVREPVDEAASYAVEGPSRQSAWTVSELTSRIKDLLEQKFPLVFVEGEISAPNYHTSGHIYFTLKDEQSELKAMLWKSHAGSLRFKLEQGMQVVCRGKVGIYAPRGIYQLYVDAVEPKGIGALQLAFEQLKEKLQKGGLFDESRKRPLPAFPERIGLVTSPRGAAIDDMLKVLDGRVETVLSPTRVQGDGAAEAIARGIRVLNGLEGLDLLIVGRGGGSLEDLWAFNEEEVARAIFSSRLPVISAVGHEKDVTISDLVADLRAATPTKAAEIVIAQRRDCLDRFAAVLENAPFTEPEEWLQEFQERLEEYQQELVDGLREPLLDAAQNLRILQGELLGCSPQATILHQAEQLHRLYQRLGSGMAHALEQTAARFLGLTGRLHALSPLAVLERGYSITFDPNGKILKNAGSVRPGDVVQTKLHRGRITSRVESKEEV